MTAPDAAEQRVFAAAAALAGDAVLAARWFHQEPLPDFHGATAAQLVAQGRANDVLRYIEMLEAGAAG